MQTPRTWHLIDLETDSLGRLATRIASLLIGKHKPGFTPNLDTGDYVVAINSDHLVLTGQKRSNKKHYRHSGYPGGFKEIPVARQLDKDSRKLVELAVRGMLPKNKLQSDRLKRLKVYPGKEHPHASQIQK